MRLRKVCPQCNTILHARRSVKDSSLYKTSRAIIRLRLPLKKALEILIHVFETYIVLPYIHCFLTLSEGFYISTVNVCSLPAPHHLPTTVDQTRTHILPALSKQD